MSPLKKSTKSSNSTLLKSVFCGFNDTFNNDDIEIEFIPKIRKGMKEARRKEKKKLI